jgi:hypothetical protein
VPKRNDVDACLSPCCMEVESRTDARALLAVRRVTADAQRPVVPTAT